MAKVRVRPETGTLYLDFSFRGVRCREQTALPDTSSNRKLVERLLARIVREIASGAFNYAHTFPSSSRAAQFADGAEPASASVPPDESASVAAAREAPAFSEFAELWFSEQKPLWRMSYVDTVREILDNRLLPAFDQRSIAAIAKADILAYRANLAERPGRSGNLTIGPARVNKIMGILRQILTEASERFDFPPPFRNIKPLRLKRSDVMPFTLTEVHRILDAVRPDYRNYLVVRFFTGMRSGEINGLLWRYVDFENNLILVRETLVQGQQQTDAKTDGSLRDIPMAPIVSEALKEQYRLRDEDSPYVFRTREGKPVDDNNFSYRIWHPLLRELGFAKRRPYETRHTAATLMLAAGENPEWVARVLGHSTTEMLFRVYSRYAPNLTRQDGRAFAGLLAGASPPKAQSRPRVAEDTLEMALEAIRKLSPQQSKALLQVLNQPNQS